MSLLRRLYLEFYFASMPIHSWLIRGRQVRSYYFQLKKSDRFSREQLDELQLQRLKEIMSHHYSTSEFFRKRLDQLGLHPSMITNLGDLSKFPLLTKDDIQSSLATGLVSTAVPVKKLWRISTSGSTGQPFSVFVDQAQLEVRFAATMRSMEWTGWKLGDRQVRLWHQTLGMSPSQIVRERIDAFLMRRKFIPAFEISAENIDSLIRVIRRHKPVLIDGYAESLNFLSIYLQSGKSLGFRPLAVMSSAQALPSASRAAIERGLQTKVFDKYGSREFSGIAYECESHNGHHVVDECYIVELLVNGRAARPGEIGEVVVTDLFNRAVPMIRYRIGDLATAVAQETACQCGRQHSRIGDIEGRTQAIVHCSNGVWLPGALFLHFFKDYQDIIQFFQIQQNKRDEFLLRVVRGPSFTEEGFDSALLALRNFVGDTKVVTQFVNEIPLLKTGKRSPVVSTLSIDFQTLNMPSQVKEETK